MLEVKRRPSGTWPDGGSIFKVCLPETDQRGMFGKWGHQIPELARTKHGNRKDAHESTRRRWLSGSTVCLYVTQHRGLLFGHCRIELQSAGGQLQTSPEGQQG